MRRVQEGLSAAGAHPLHPAQGSQLLQVFLLHIHSGKLSPNSGGRIKEGRLSSRRRTTKGMFAARKTEATPPSDLQASLVQDRLESKSFCYQSPFPFCAPYCTNKKMAFPQTEPEEGAAESSVKSEVDVKKQLFTTDAETNTVSSSGQS